MKTDRPQIPFIAENKQLMIPGKTKPDAFSEVYKGSYPECYFTALTEQNGIWYVAGCDDNAYIRLFTSTDGMTWSEQDLSLVYATSSPELLSEVVAILPGIAAEELLLICRSGYVISVPDCPHCIEISRFSEQNIVSAWREGNFILWKDIQGEQDQLTVEHMVQHRVTWPWVHKHKATLINLQKKNKDEQETLPFGYTIPLEAFDHILRRIPRDAYFVLMSASAVCADETARNARKKGWINCRSMGSIQMVLS